MGFLTLKYHTVYAAEIYVMGLDARFHRQGLGRALVEHAESLLRLGQIEYLQVKTLAPSVVDEYYIWHPYLGKVRCRSAWKTSFTPRGW